MKLAVLKETNALEKRVAATPDSIKRFVALGANVTVQEGAGTGAGISDNDFKQAGAAIAKDTAATVKGADIALCVNAPDAKIRADLPKGIALIGMLAPYNKDADIDSYAKSGVQSFSLEMLPRISRAQSMDVLSSQSNLAGYRAVIDAVAQFGKVVPMMMTAAGTVTPARALILGAGVAGLQAIATAKRLGAVVSAFDVRPVVKEQVESLGATFIEVPAEETDGETAGGYAKEMSDDYKRKQSELIAETIKTQDIIITTALIPGRPAPTLIDEAMVDTMKTGAVIIDLAAASGGNCSLSQPDKVVDHHGVQIVGYTNMPSRAAVDASALYARNLYNFISTLMVKDGKFAINWDDELITGTNLTRDGKLVHEMFKSAAKPTAKKPAAATKSTPKKTTAKKPAAKKPAAKKSGATTKKATGTKE